jgi:hypothetical protein
LDEIGTVSILQIKENIFGFSELDYWRGIASNRIHLDAGAFGSVFPKLFETERPKPRSIAERNQQK